MRNSSFTGWVQDTQVDGATSDGTECAVGVFYCTLDGYYMGVKFRGAMSAADATERLALYTLKGKYLNSDTTKYVIIPVTLTNLNKTAICASRTLTVNSQGQLVEIVDGDMTATAVTTTEEAIASAAKANVFSTWEEEGNDTSSNVNDDTPIGGILDETSGNFDDGGL